MKKTMLCLAFSLVFQLGALYVALAQEGTGRREVPAVEPAPLTVSQHKTTHLVFPYAVKSVDRGSADILVQQATPAEHILRVKAAKAHFRETNLTVITADGVLYSFLVRYAENPAQLTIRLPGNEQGTGPGAIFTGAGDREAIMAQDAADVASRQVRWGVARDRSFGIQLQVGGIYIRDDVMYYQIRIHNCSAISYDTDQLRFFIRDRRQAKRTASQEQELSPLYVLGSPEHIAGHSEQLLVYALPKVTVPDRKHLVIQLLEKQGGRHLQLKLHNRQLVRAEVLPAESVQPAT